MTISTQRGQPRPKPLRRSKSAAFTLVEILLASSLGAILMAGVMTTVIALTKAGYNANNYGDMEYQARLGLELFARDVRSSRNITWNSASKITLTVPASKAGDPDLQYTYEYADGNFIRTQIAPTTSTPQTLFSGIDPTSFSLVGYKVSVDINKVPTPVDTTSATSLAQASTDTKQLQLSMKLQRTGSILNKSSGDVISARFILRNKQVTN